MKKSNLLPAYIHQGDTLSFELPQEYRQPDVRFALAFSNDGNTKVFRSSDGVFDISWRDTSILKSGRQSWRLFSENTSTRSRSTIGIGSIEILDVSLDDSTLTHAEKVLNAIEAILEDPTAIEAGLTMIEGRQLQRRTLTELMALRDKYDAIVRRENVGLTFGKIRLKGV